MGDIRDAVLDGPSPGEFRLSIGYGVVVEPLGEDRYLVTSRADAGLPVEAGDSIEVRVSLSELKQYQMVGVVEGSMGEGWVVTNCSVERVQRRQHVRVRAGDVPATLVGVDADVAVQLVDISAGGASVLTATGLTIGDQFRLLAELPGADDDDAPIHFDLAATIVRCNPLGANQRGARLYGLQFSDVSARVEDEIVKWVFNAKRAR